MRTILSSPDYGRVTFTLSVPVLVPGTDKTSHATNSDVAAIHCIVLLILSLVPSPWCTLDSFFHYVYTFLHYLSFMAV